MKAPEKMKTMKTGKTDWRGETLAHPSRIDSRAFKSLVKAAVTRNRAKNK